MAEEDVVIERIRRDMRLWGIPEQDYTDEEIKKYVETFQSNICRFDFSKAESVIKLFNSFRKKGNKLPSRQKVLQILDKFKGGSREIIYKRRKTRTGGHIHKMIGPVYKDGRFAGIFEIIFQSGGGIAGGSF